MFIRTFLMFSLLGLVACADSATNDQVACTPLEGGYSYKDCAYAGYETGLDTAVPGDVDGDTGVTFFDTGRPVHLRPFATWNPGTVGPSPEQPVPFNYPGG